MDASLIGGYLNPGLIAYAVVAVFLAGIVRGYTGFGFSALVMLSLALFLPPALIMPILVLLEIAASIHMLPGVWRQVDRRILGWLMLGTVIGVPPGVFLLATLPADQMRLVISVLVLLVTIILWRGFRLPTRGGWKLVLGTGLASGAIAGSAGMGGLVAVVMFLSISAAVEVVRATMVAFLMLQGIYTLGVAGAYDLVNAQVFLAAVALALPLFAGVVVGHRIFQVTTAGTFRRFVLLILAVLSVTGILRALLG